MMWIEDGIIKECTVSELHRYWLTRGYDEMYSFSQFKDAMKELGTVVREDEEDDRD